MYSVLLNCHMGALCDKAFFLIILSYMSWVSFFLQITNPVITNQLYAVRSTILLYSHMSFHITF